MSSSQFDRALWIVGRRKQLDVSAIWSQFHYAGIPNEMLVSFNSPDINRASIKASKIEELLDGAHVPSFEILGAGFSFDCGQSGGQNYDRVFIEASSTVLNPEFCDELISQTVAGVATEAGCIISTPSNLVFHALEVHGDLAGWCADIEAGAAAENILLANLQNDQLLVQDDQSFALMDCQVTFT